VNAVQDEVNELVKKELKAANEKFPLFNSDHEGYAVIKEELEETNEELTYAQLTFANLWENVKDNKTMPTLNHAEGVRFHAINLAIEAIQLAAMAQKFIDSSNARNDK
jgi:hypothetical protein